MAKAKNKRNNAIWKISVHADLNKGPNRVLYDPIEAKRFWSRINKSFFSGIIAEHIKTGFVLKFGNTEEYERFLNTLVNKIGVNKHDRGFYKS